MARVLPKELSVTVQQQVDPRLKSLQNLDAEALGALGGIMNAIVEAKAGGVDPGTVFTAIETNLAAWLAKPVLESES